MDGSKTRRNELLKVFTKNVQSKQEFSSIPEEHILKILQKHTTEKELQKLEEHSRPEKATLFKDIVKRVRKELHDTHGVFQIKIKERRKLLTALRNAKTKEEQEEIHKKILLTHQSTKERIQDYEYIYSELEKRCTFTSILDISSGINPVSNIYLKKKVEWIATELTKEDVDFLNEYFKIMNIKGRAYQENLLTAKEFPKTDVCFLFKVLDNLETQKRNSTRELLEKIPAKNLVISFPKTSISGKSVSTKRLSWFKKIVREYETFETRNEIFYIIKR